MDCMVDCCCGVILTVVYSLLTKSYDDYVLCVQALLFAILLVMQSTSFAFPPLHMALPSFASISFRILASRPVCPLFIIYFVQLSNFVPLGGIPTHASNSANFSSQLFILNPFCSMQSTSLTFSALYTVPPSFASISFQIFASKPKDPLINWWSFQLYNLLPTAGILTYASKSVNVSSQSLIDFPIPFMDLRHRCESHRPIVSIFLGGMQLPIAWISSGGWSIWVWYCFLTVVLSHFGW